MLQINNGFKENYFLTIDGQVYNIETGKYIPIDRRNYKLKTIDNTYKKISLKELYLLVYNKVFCIDDIENLDNEIWKPIEETNGTYFISNMGRIKSYKSYKARILKPFITNGYPRVDIKYNNERNTHLVHRLTAQYFLPLPKETMCQIHHIDGDKTNSKVSNLVWLSPKEHRKLHKNRGNKENE